jgi:hypothetical protein
LNIDELLRERGGIMLDIGCGANKQTNFVGMDVRPLDGVDIVHDFNVHPWPLPDGCVISAIASHVVEHVPPVSIGPDGTRFPFIEFMDEVWRVLKVGGDFAIVVPHGRSSGYLQDPTHVNACNENTWFYFVPSHPLWSIYQPRPWAVKARQWSPTTNIEVVLTKVLIEESDDGIVVSNAQEDNPPGDDD